MKKSLLALASCALYICAASSLSAQDATTATTTTSVTTKEQVVPQKAAKVKKDGKLKEISKEAKAILESTPSCQNILGECKKLGFVEGEYKIGNGLWRSCFHPVVNGKAVTQKGNAVTVTADANDVTACKEVVAKNKATKKALKNS